MPRPNVDFQYAKAKKAEGKSQKSVTMLKLNKRELNAQQLAQYRQAVVVQTFRRGMQPGPSSVLPALDLPGVRSAITSAASMVQASTLKARYADALRVPDEVPQAEAALKEQWGQHPVFPEVGGLFRMSPSQKEGAPVVLRGDALFHRSREWDSEKS